MAVYELRVLLCFGIILFQIETCLCQDTDCYDNGTPISTGPTAIEGECEFYYMCSNGQLIEMSCGEGLAFNPEISNCDRIQNVNGCRDLDGTAGATDYYCYDEQGNFVDKLPFPKPGTCDTYYECSYGQLTERKCVPGLIFNPVSMACDYPTDPPTCIPSATTIFPDANENPSATILPKSTTRQDITQQSTTSLDTSSQPPTTYLPTTTVKSTTYTILTSTINSQEQDCYENGIPISKGPTAIEGECEFFYMCSNGQRTEISCGEGLAFNPEILVCDNIQNVPGCRDMDGTGASDYYCFDKDGNFVYKEPFLKPGSCDTYYQCLNGISIVYAI
uniref:chitin-binding domain protein cbd-1-like n=1 Tax=Ciona intestinalis TaxID=7719 RepID=UPI000EF4E160|nr:chitin-binding domain protein cbd-1-like [Ciona intestinalis]|eukprot:XP_026692616.1 chitin-binding domain protein cbd-1-like [Ciona intestinalis]